MSVAHHCQQRHPPEGPEGCHQEWSVQTGAREREREGGEEEEDGEEGRGRDGCVSSPPAGVALLWVAALGVVVLFIYAVISFAFLDESVNEQGENALFCETLGQCFVSVIRWGLIDNLGLVWLHTHIRTHAHTHTHTHTLPSSHHPQVVPLVPEEFRTSGLRILYDVSFFIIVTTIGLNIVFGIIVDTFSELRDERVRE